MFYTNKCNVIFKTINTFSNSTANVSDSADTVNKNTATFYTQYSQVALIP